jgi:hypothetical protein
MTIYNSALDQFIPTWLFIKQQNKTKLKYFGKTTRNPKWYHGSGKYWKRHLRVHGGRDNIDTLWCKLFTSKDKLTRFAILFSKLNKIVESKEWANLKIENGLDGGFGILSPESREKQRQSLIGRKIDPIIVERIAAKLRGKKHHKNFGQNVSKGKIGRPRKKLECHHCKLIVNCANLSRHILSAHGSGTNKKGSTRPKKSCSYCHKFFGPGVLTRHINRIHKGNAPPYKKGYIRPKTPCPYCQQYFGPGALTNHIQAKHTKPFESIVINRLKCSS